MSCHCGETHHIDHGSCRGYQQHIRLHRAGHTDVEPCEVCRAANAAYMRGWRVHSRDKQRQLEDRQSCRKRALTRLGQLYRAELEVLYAQELESAGLT